MSDRSIENAPSTPGMLKLGRLSMAKIVYDAVVVKEGSNIVVLRVIQEADGAVQVDSIDAGTVSRPGSGRLEAPK